MKNETPEDVAEELAVAGVLAEKWNCELHKLPEFSYLDYAVVRNGFVTGWVEIKSRKVHWGTYNEVLLSVAKWSHGLSISRATGLPFVLVIAYTDFITHLKVGRHEPQIQITGRRDRGGHADIEPCVMLPLCWFTKTCKRTQGE